MKKRPGAGALTVKLRGAVGIPIKLLVTAFIAMLAGTIAASKLRDDTLGWAVAAAVIVAGAIYAWQTAAGRIVVGDDGVHLERAPKDRFIPYGEVRSVERFQELAMQARGSLGREGKKIYIPAVRMALASGESVEIPLVNVPDETIDALVERVWSGLTSAGSSSDRPTLDRGGRSASAWREALAKEVQSANFRGKARTVDELDAVLADPTSRAEDRVGAALALRATGAEGATDRIRVAASASANPRLRIALDAAAEDALDDQMLDAIAEEERSRGAG